ncbi:MAG: addiction module protein [Lacipirellulaceae bacterium]
MPVDLPLDSMSVADKLATIETIWASLCQKPSDVESPAWHEEVLKERKRRLESGEATLSPWQEVKQRLQKLGQ